MQGTARAAPLYGMVAVSVLSVAGCNLASPRYYGGFDVGSGAVASSGASNVVVTPAGSGASTNAGDGAASVAGTVTAPPGAPPAVQLDAVAQTLRAQGYVPVSAPLQVRGAAGGLSSHGFMPQLGNCYVAVAIGGAGITSMAMVVSAPSGANIGYYSRGDTHPWVSFCAYEYGFYFPRVMVGAGEGEFYYQLFQGPPATSAMLAGVWSAGAMQRRAPASIDAATQRRVEALTQSLRAQGYQLVVQPRAAMLGRGEIVSFPASLREGFCYAFASFGGPGARDTDLYLYDAQGAAVQRDESADVDAIVRDVCITSPGQYVLRPRMAEGDGPVWIAAFARSAQSSGGAQVTSTTMSLAQASASGNDIDDIWNSQQSLLQSVGYQPEGSPLNRTLTEGQSADETVALAAGQCYAIMAVGESRVRDLDIDLNDSSNRPVDRDYAQDPKAIVRLCVPTAGQYRVTVRMVTGGGAYRLGLFRWTGGTSGAGLSGIAFVRNAEVTRVLQSDGYQGDASFDIVRGQIREGASVQRNVSLRANQCYAFVGVGGAGVSDLDLSVSKDGQTVAEDRTFTAFPTVRFCTRSAGSYRVTITSRRGSGEFVFRVFRREAQ